MNRLNLEDRSRIVSCLVEGNSIRSTVRMTGVAKNTVTKLLVDIGRACSEYQDKVFRHLKCKRIQCDEIWSFCGSKEKNTKPDKKAIGWGDVWTWTALCPDTKLIPCWFVGDRSAGSAYHFVHDLQERLSDRVQLTTDGHKAYLSAVEDAFGSEVDYGQLVKLYGNEPGQKPTAPAEIRYSPAQCMGARKTVISGMRVYRHVSTSHIERQNLSMRMGNAPRTTSTHLRSTFMYYNFARIHQTLRVTPAMEAGIADHVWDINEIVGLIEKLKTQTP